MSQANYPMLAGYQHRHPLADYQTTLHILACRAAHHCQQAHLDGQQAAQSYAQGVADGLRYAGYGTAPARLRIVLDLPDPDPPRPLPAGTHIPTWADICRADGMPAPTWEETR